MSARGFKLNVRRRAGGVNLYLGVYIGSNWR